jgi:hypothetical protein
MVRLGVTFSATGTGNIFSIMTAPVVLNQPTDSVHGLAYAIGTLTLAGNLVTANGANLNINKSSGTLHAFGFGYAANGANNPNLVTSPAETAATFRQLTQITNSESSATTTFDASHWDNAGVLTTISGGTASIHRVFLMPSGIAGSQIYIQYGQATYGNLANALSGIQTEVFTVNPDLGVYGCLIGYIISTANATTLNNAGQATFVPAGKFAFP